MRIFLSVLVTLGLLMGITRVGFEVGVALADTGSAMTDAGSGSGSSSGSAAAPATSTLHDPMANPVLAASDLAQFYKSGGWSLALLVGAYLLLELASKAGDKISALAFLEKGRTKIVIAAAIAIAGAMVNSLALGGSWSAALAAAVGGALLYWHPAGVAQS